MNKAPNASDAIACPGCDAARNEVERCSADPGTPRTVTIPGLQRTTSCCAAPGTREGCEKPFSVAVGTVFERSHVPLHLWLYAMHLMTASKKGISAHQMHRMLGVTYKTAWFMAHRSGLRPRRTVGHTYHHGSVRQVHNCPRERGAFLAKRTQAGSMRASEGPTCGCAKWPPG